MVTQVHSVLLIAMVTQVSHVHTIPGEDLPVQLYYEINLQIYRRVLNNLYTLFIHTGVHFLYITSAQHVVK